MRIVLFGPPASGKGTQAYKLKETLGIPHVSTGDMLRQAAQEPGSLGDEVRAVPTGTFASDDLILRLIQAELDKPAYKKGVILDGFPRTKAQAEAMIKMGLDVDVVIEFKVDQEVLTERIINRRVHPSSGRIYNLLSHPPKQEGVDDVTGETLIHRADDTLDVVVGRFKDFDLKTRPAIEAFKQATKGFWIQIDGMRSEDEVAFDVQQGLDTVSRLRKMCPKAHGTLVFDGQTTPQPLKKPKMG